MKRIYRIRAVVEIEETDKDRCVTFIDIGHGEYIVQGSSSEESAKEVLRLLKGSNNETNT